MTQCLYQNQSLEGKLCDRLYAATGCDPRSPIVERRTQEAAAIFQSGQASLFALAGELVDFSLSYGYPVSFRGEVGSLLVSHLLGFAQNDPIDLGIPWQGAFSPDGLAPNITLNFAPEVVWAARHHLKEIAEGCNVLWDVPGLPPQRVVFAPERYDPDHEYLTLDIFSYRLLGQVGDAAKRAARLPRREEVLSPDFIRWAWALDNMWEVPVLREIAPLRDYAPEIEPVTFAHLTRLLGLALLPSDRWAPLNEPDVTLDMVAGTREDVYENRLRDGVPPGDALAALQKERELYPRGQCAEYLTYGLLLAWFWDNEE